MRFMDEHYLNHPTEGVLRIRDFLLALGYLEYMQQHFQNFDYRGGYYSDGTYYQAAMGGGHGGYTPTKNISYDALHPHELWSVGPGQGKNGKGSDGVYYDWYTDKYRSTSTTAQVSWRDVYRDIVLLNAQAVIDVAGIRKNEKKQWVKGLTASLGRTEQNSILDNINYALPVAITWAAVGSVEGVMSGQVTPVGYGIILRGPDRFQSIGFSSIGAGAGWIGTDGSIATTYYFYTGDVNNFDRRSLNGQAWDLSVSCGEGWSIGINLALAQDRTGAYIIGIGPSAGVGLSPSFWTGQYSMTLTKIWGNE